MLTSQAVFAKPGYGNESDPKRIRVALAGCGTVGGELVRLVHERSGSIEQRQGVRFEFATILVRDVTRPRRDSVPADVLTTDIDSFMATDADIVVEAIGGVDPARRIAAETLATGRTFVTANKALLAAHGPELVALAGKSGGRLLYEASVGGGVPVIRVLRDALAETGVRGIRGILNGTTNYILTRMSDGIPFQAALAEAQSLGYAEADPSRDLDGRDAADKVAVLAWLAFGTDPRTLAVARRGLLPDPDRLIADAVSMGGVTRLIGECIVTDIGVAAAVEPVVLPAGSMLAQASGPENLIAIDTQHNGTIQLSGPGAGGSATASALLSDMMHGASGVGAHVSITHPVPDPRTFSWLISVFTKERGDVSLQRVLRAANIETEIATEDHAAGVFRVITRPCTRARISIVERDLKCIGLAPIISRYEAVAPSSSSASKVFAYVG